MPEAGVESSWVIPVSAEQRLTSQEGHPHCKDISGSGSLCPSTSALYPSHLDGLEKDTVSLNPFPGQKTSLLLSQFSYLSVYLFFHFLFQGLFWVLPFTLIFYPMYGEKLKFVKYNIGCIHRLGKEFFLSGKLQFQGIKCHHF